VLQSLLEVTWMLVRRADPARVRDIKEMLAGPAAELLREAEPGSDRQLVWVQLLSWTATSAGQLDLLAGLLDGSTQIPGLAVDTDLRWRLLSRLVETGQASDDEIDAELARDDTDAGRRYAQACRAAVPDVEHKAAAWRLVAESSELSYEGAVRVALAFNQPEHADLLAPYAEKYFEQLPGIWEVRTELVRMLFGGTLFPYTQASPELLARVDEFLAQPDLEHSLRRTVIEGRDRAEKGLRARALPD
jgi:aminopeptidase N